MHTTPTHTYTCIYACACLLVYLSYGCYCLIFNTPASTVCFLTWRNLHGMVRCGTSWYGAVRYVMTRHRLTVRMPLFKLKASCLTLRYVSPILPDDDDDAAAPAPAAAVVDVDNSNGGVGWWCCYYCCCILLAFPVHINMYVVYDCFSRQPTKIYMFIFHMRVFPGINTKGKKFPFHMPLRSVRACAYVCVFNNYYTYFRLAVELALIP